MDLQQRHYLARMGKSFANSVRDENLIEARKTARKALNNKAAKYIAEGAKGATRRAGLNEAPFKNYLFGQDPRRMRPLGGPNPFGRSAGGDFGRPFPNITAQYRPTYNSPGGRPIYNGMGLPARPGAGILPGDVRGGFPSRPAPGSNMRGMGRPGGFPNRPGTRPIEMGLPGLPPVPPSVRFANAGGQSATAPRPNAPQTGGPLYPGRPGGIYGGFGGSRPTLPNGMNPPPR